MEGVPPPEMGANEMQPRPGLFSGPDGEFVFAVTHDPGLDLTDGIATLPGFGARVTNEAPGELTVAARDPESEG
jgi:hypothetical protein